MFVFLPPRHHELFSHLDETHVDVYDFDRNGPQLDSKKSNRHSDDSSSYILLPAIDARDPNPNALRSFDKLHDKKRPENLAQNRSLTLFNPTRCCLIVGFCQFILILIFFQHNRSIDSADKRVSMHTINTY